MQITLFSLALVAVLSAAPPIIAQSGFFRCICETNGVQNTEVSLQCCRDIAGESSPADGLPCLVLTAAADRFLACCDSLEEGGSC
ncbi:hypothetical protein FB451DRAFT_1395276 [Mycena latifolia]|nr:hypothetical protein FB451DRAFT_1395276 [Mycena latifolia]